LKKYVGYMVAFVFGTYLWFVLLPMWFNYSFPTGGWDWLGFVGVVGGLFFCVVFEKAARVKCCSLFGC